MIKSPRVLGGPNSDRWGQPVRQIQDLNSWEPWQPLCCELSAGLCTRRSPTPAGHSSSGGCRVFGTPGARARGRLPRLLVCDLAAYHGEACMRPLRRQRRLPCRCGALSCGTTAGCAAATLRASRRSARSPMSWKLVGLAGLSGSAAASLMWASLSAPGPRCLPVVAVDCRR